MAVCIGGWTDSNNWDHIVVLHAAIAYADERMATGEGRLVFGAGGGHHGEPVRTQSKVGVSYLHRGLTAGEGYYGMIPVRVICTTGRIHIHLLFMFSVRTSLTRME